MANQFTARARDAFGARVVGRRPDGDPVIRLEIYGIVVLAFAIALALALLTFDPIDVGPTGGTRYQPAENAIGPIGAHVADLFLGAMGLGAFALTACFAWLGAGYLFGRRWRIAKADVGGWLGLLLAASVMLHVLFAPGRFLGHLPGGLMGEYVGEISRALLSTTGTVLIAVTLSVTSIVALTRRSIFELCVLLWRGTRRGAGRIFGLLRHGDRAEDETFDYEDDANAAPIARETLAADELQPVTRGRVEPADDEAGPRISVPVERTIPADIHERPTREEPAQNGQAPDRAPAAPAAPAARAESPGVEETAARESPRARLATTPRVPTPEPEPEPEAAVDSPPLDQAAVPDNIRIVESAAMRRSRDLVVGEQVSLLQADEADEAIPFELPSLSFLDYVAPEGQTYDREKLRDNARTLEAALADYKVEGKVVEIHPGPVVTMYEFKPAAGIKISRIANLSDDLAMALSALRIRIVAPIPGKDVVGIEVPNATRETVWLKEILSDPAYSKAKGLTLALGKDIVGNPTTMNLAKAPHLLVAGATGAGKSVAINSFICSMLYSASPADVRLIMIDPKMLELSIYEGIPHLLLPVVTDPKQASTALRWAVREMTRRYQLMADLGVRNLANFNAKVDGILESDEPKLPEKLRVAKNKRREAGMEDPDGVVLDASGEPLERLPLIVVIVDELADLMMVAGKDVELAIARLAQMARAAGIHLILATQRPSVDVITGLIKANFPSRISFRVASKIDSRTILDQQGADSLLGMGDMLWLAPGSSSPKRVHGCFVSEEEVHLIVKHLKTQGSPDYKLDILADPEGEDGGPLEPRGDDYDEHYDTAIRIVSETRNASISFLQRKLKIGYNRAARIVEKMEEEGVVGPSDGTSRPREVFVDPV